MEKSPFWRNKKIRLALNNTIRYYFLILIYHLCFSRGRTVRWCGVHTTSASSLGPGDLGCEARDPAITPHKVDVIWENPVHGGEKCVFIDQLIVLWLQHRQCVCLTRRHCFVLDYDFYLLLKRAFPEMDMYRPKFIRPRTLSNLNNIFMWININRKE